MLHSIPPLPADRQAPTPHHRYPASAVAAAHNDGKLHLILAASGSVAVIKLPLIAEKLLTIIPPARLSIRIVLTDAASRFLAGQSAEQPTVSALGHVQGVDGVYGDADEWGPEPWRRGAPILHVELRKWAHLMVVAPLGANTLAEIVAGGCSGLLTSVVRAWDGTGRVDGLVELPSVGDSSSSSSSTPRPRVRKRILAAPAMNTAMWEHPVTARQIAVLERDWGAPPLPSQPGLDSAVDAAADAAANDPSTGWFEVLRPQADKRLACGDVGAGAMMAWEEIVRIVAQRLGAVV